MFYNEDYIFVYCKERYSEKNDIYCLYDGNNIYYGIMYLYEYYGNVIDCNYCGYCLIYSYNLFNENLELLNNRFADIQDNVDKEEVATKD